MVSRCFPGGYNVKLYISRSRLAWWLLALLHSATNAIEQHMLENALTMMTTVLTKTTTFSTTTTSTIVISTIVAVAGDVIINEGD